MNFAILRRPRTQALLDGTIAFDVASVRWLPVSDPLGWALPSHERHRDLAAVELDGGEMSISSFFQAKSRGAPLVALPIFLKRGLVQRSLFCLTGARLTAPDQLIGKRVGLVSSTSSMAVWMRAVLSNVYGLDGSSVRWTTVSGASDDIQLLNIPDEYLAEKISAQEELDGYPHALDRREVFLLTLLERRELDAVVSFQAKIDDGRIRPLLHEDKLWDHPLSRQIYPINHLFVVKTAVVEKFPSVAESVLSAFRKARLLWTKYQATAERQVFERETAKLGYDPFAYSLGEAEKRTLEFFCSQLNKENLIPDELPLNEIFLPV